MAKITENVKYEPCHEKTGFCLCENKGADQLRGNHEADLISAYVFTTWIETSLFSLNPKFQASSLLLLLYVGLCCTWSAILQTVFFSHRGLYNRLMFRSFSLLKIYLILDIKLLACFCDCARLCQNGSEHPKTSFLMSRINCVNVPTVDSSATCEGPNGLSCMMSDLFLAYDVRSIFNLFQFLQMVDINMTTFFPFLIS